MIHRDLCDPQRTKEYSSLRLQFHFLLSRFVCLDGFIPLTQAEMADNLSCSIQSIKKFIKKGKKDGILREEGNRLYLNSRVEDYKSGYVKHYSFLESDTFKTLSIHAQRFVLYLLWFGVSKKRPFYRNIDTLYHSTDERNGVLNVYEKNPMYGIIHEVGLFFNVSIKSGNGREMIYVTGLRDKYAQEDVMNNKGEEKLLQDILVKHDCDIFVSDKSLVDLIKIKYEYVRKFKSVGLELFDHALRKLLSTDKLYQLEMEESGIGKYFRAIIKDLENKIVPKLDKLIRNIKGSVNTLKSEIISGVDKHVRNFESKLATLQDVYNQLRMKSDDNDTFAQFEFYNWLENT